MSTSDLKLTGTHGTLVVRYWSPPRPRFVVLLAHGYGEHAGRYAHVAERLGQEGAIVYAPDHAGHGRSDGPRARFDQLEDMVTDLRAVCDLATTDHSGLPLVLVGHSMGSLIATRYVQRYGGDGLSALVLSGLIIGGNPGLTGLLQLDPIPDVPIDPAILSNDAAVGRAYADDPLVYHGPLSRESLEGVVASVDAVAAGGALGDVPTLWVHGQLDQLAPLAVNRQAMEAVRGRHLEVKVYPGAQHEIFNETNKDEVLDDVADFILRQLQG